MVFCYYNVSLLKNKKNARNAAADSENNLNQYDFDMPNREIHKQKPRQNEKGNIVDREGFSRDCSLYY